MRIETYSAAVCESFDACDCWEKLLLRADATLSWGASVDMMGGDVRVLNRVNINQNVDSR